MERRQFVFSLLALSAAPLLPAALPRREPIVGLPCEGCEAVFDGRPDHLTSQSRIAPETEPGQPLTLEGIVRDRNGLPRAGVIVYAYHTNAGGIYPTGPRSPAGSAGRHGLLRGWARTDAQGGYRFDTIRPGAYPGRNLPEHIHMHVIEPGRATYYIDDVMFRDDPKLTADNIRKLAPGRGGSGIVTPEHREGTWWVRRDIVLGERIPGHPDHPAA